jgi:hypothetical protein
MNFLYMKKHKYTVEEVEHGASIKLANFNHPIKKLLYNYLIHCSCYKILPQNVMCLHE